ncbi:MAG: homoserine O-succinyltransferase [Lachnospiraceae bacterium]|nr:homoserine O-succinyltransferase [Lachnospiraceae bacterium]MBR5657784.1 homoserine O-succinyltransferase [Lachnospiraceae bacterium]
MPIKVQNDLPAREVLDSENIFTMDETRASSQDIRPLEIAILNLMPLKEDYETQLLRALSNTPLQLELTFLRMATHESKNTSIMHLNKFYKTFDEVRNRYFDGMIITGAPLETIEFEDVNYWPELTRIMDWSKRHVTSTMHICWGALAGLYYHFGLHKVPVEVGKYSGIYLHRVLDRRSPIVRSFDDVFYAPHSRYSTVTMEEIEKTENLDLLAVSDEAGPYLLKSRDGKQIFILGHPEYDRLSLDMEYKRDVNKGLNIAPPQNYYADDNSEITPILTWRCHANTLYSNWLNYYVYQVTPYHLDEMEDKA